MDDQTNPTSSFLLKFENDMDMLNIRVGQLDMEVSKHGKSDEAPEDDTTLIKIVSDIKVYSSTLFRRYAALARRGNIPTKEIEDNRKLLDKINSANNVNPLKESVSEFLENLISFYTARVAQVRVYDKDPTKSFT